MDNNTYHTFDGNMVILLTCSNCNVKCKHCYVSYKGQFTREKLLEVVNSLIPRYTVAINGTEPLLHREYLEAIKLVGQKRILTNGLVFKDNYDYIDEVKACGIDLIGISYHFDIHDDISMVSKEYLDKLFQEIIRRGVNVQVMTTITSANYKEVPKYCAYCYDNGIRAIRFTNFLKQGNAKNLDDNLVLTDEERYAFFKTIDDMREIYPKDKLIIQRCGSFGNNPNSRKEFNCTAGTGFVAITPDLNAYPCIFLAQPGNEIGYYQDGNIYIRDDYVHNSHECNAVLKLNKRR